MNVKRPPRLLRRADRRGQAGRRAALPAPEGHHDEGLRPRHVRPRRVRLLQGRLREARRHPQGTRRRTPTTASATSSPSSRHCPPPEARRSRPTSRPSTPRRPALAMVNSDKGITNLHVPNDIIVDASMPAVIRDGGKMWDADGKLHDTLAMIPDRCYATIYQDRHRRLQEARRLRSRHHGQRPQRRPHGPEGRGIRLPRQDLHRPGRRHHPGRGRLRRQPCSHRRSKPGDILRVCQTKDAPIQDWVKLAVNRARATGAPAVFWLDKARAHDAQIIAKVETLPQGPRHHRPRHPHPDPGRGHAGSPASASARARTPSPSPATSCATTSPTSSPSSNWAPAPRCSPSCR